MGQKNIVIDLPSMEMVECGDQPCTFLVQKSDGFLCPDGCGKHFCTNHRTLHYCPAREDRRLCEKSERWTELWRQGKLGYDTPGQFIESERYFGFGPLYHVKRKGRWYYYRFRSFSCFYSGVTGEPVWSVWAERTDKAGEEDLGFSNLELEHLTEIEFVG